MNRSPLSVAGMMGLVICFALATAAFLRPTPDRAIATSATVLGSFFLAIPLAIYRRGGTRAFLIGFLVFGWGYLVLDSVPVLGDRLGISVEQQLTRLLRWADLAKNFPPPEAGDEVEVGWDNHYYLARIQYLNPASPAIPYSAAQLNFANGSSGLHPLSSMTRHHELVMRRVGLSLAQFLIATLGGILSLICQKTLPPPASVVRNTSPTPGAVSP